METHPVSAPFSAVMLLSLMSTALGCEEMSRLTQETSQKSTPTDIQIVRAVKLGSKWEMKQMRFEVEAGSEVAILLKLSNNDNEGQDASSQIMRKRFEMEGKEI